VFRAALFRIHVVDRFPLVGRNLKDLAFPLNSTMFGDASPLEFSPPITAGAAM
jgi:hypothetical protein